MKQCINNLKEYVGLRLEDILLGSRVFRWCLFLCYTEIGKAKQANRPMAPGFQKLWVISKTYHWLNPLI